MLGTVLGVDIFCVLSWNSHIDRITGNANRTLGFIGRNIRTKLPKVRETAYNTQVRPQVEFASPYGTPFPKMKYSRLKRSKGERLAGTQVILALGQALQ